MSRMNWAADGGIYYAAPSEYIQYIIAYEKTRSVYVTEVDQCEVDGRGWHTTQYHEFLSLADAKHWCEVHFMVAT